MCCTKEQSFRPTSVWREVIRQGGGDPEALTTALVRLNKAMGDGSPIVKALGLDTADTGHAFMQLMASLSSDPDKANATANKPVVTVDGLPTLCVGSFCCDEGTEWVDDKGCVVSASAPKPNPTLDGQLLTDSTSLDKGSDSSSSALDRSTGINRAALDD